MNILFVDPGWNGEGAIAGGAPQTNLGMCRVAASTSAAGHKVIVLQPPLNMVSMTKVVALASQSDVLGISCMDWNTPNAIELAEAVRAVSPRTLIAVGGIAPTSVPNEFLAKGMFDAVFVGEGEEAFPTWLQNPKSGKVCAARIQDLTRFPLPVPDPEVVCNSYMRGIFPIPRTDQRVDSAMCTRGCLNRCLYCSSAVEWQGCVVRDDPERIAKHLIWCHKEHGINSVDMIDATWNADPDWVLEICEIFNRFRVREHIKWTAMCSPAITKRCDTMYVAMAEAGCVKVGFGIEDPTTQGRRALGKAGNIATCQRVMQAAADAGLVIRDYAMWSLPNQDEDVLQSMGRLSEIFPGHEIRLGNGVPFRGTPWRAALERQGYQISSDLSRYDTNRPVIAHPIWSEEKLLAHHKWILCRFYGSEPWRERSSKLAARGPEWRAAVEAFKRDVLRPRGFIE